MSRFVPRNRLLYLPHIHLLRLLDPRLLGLLGRDPRQLSRLRHVELAALNGLLNHRQLRQRIREPQPILRDPMRRVPELSHHVVSETRVPELPPQLKPLRLSQRLGLLQIEMRSRLRDPLQRSMQHDEFLVDNARRGTNTTTDLHTLVHHHGSTITTMIFDALIRSLDDVHAIESIESRRSFFRSRDARTSTSRVVQIAKRESSSESTLKVVKYKSTSKAFFTRWARDSRGGRTAASAAATPAAAATTAVAQERAHRAID
jgi:hypothetical protein